MKNKVWFHQVKKAVKVFGLIGLCFFVLFQVFQWKTHAIQVTYLQFKNQFSRYDEKSFLEMGSICNTLGKFKCSVDVFTKIIERDPQHKSAIANLAIAEARLGRWRRANKAFEAYFSLGGQSYDSMYWYAKTLASLNNSDRSIDWFYRSLARNSDYTEAANDLIDLLIRGGRFIEALGLIGSYSLGQPELRNFWNEKLKSVERYILKTRERVKFKDEAKIPSFDGQNFFVPAWFEERGEIIFMQMNLKQKHSQIQEGQLQMLPSQLLQEVQESLFMLKQKKPDAQHYKVRIPQIFIAGWRLPELEFQVCRDCVPTLGLNILVKLQLRQFRNSGTDFLVLTHSKENF